MALSLILRATAEEFDQLTACVRALDGLWRRDEEEGVGPGGAGGRSFIKHFYYEVSAVLLHVCVHA